MAMLSPSELLDWLGQNQFLSTMQTDALRPLLPSFPDTMVIAKELMRRDWLTAYQINQIMQGKHEQLVLSGYRLRERIGEGAMGQIFMAWSLRLGRLVAVKTLTKQLINNDKAMERFRKEVATAAQLDHPNIALVRDAGEDGNRPFLVMDFIDGVNLSQYVKQQGPLPIHEAVEYARQTALGLQHAFERGIVHRDIKPANLMIASTRTAGEAPLVKILDFGLARFQSEEDNSTRLTQVGRMLGTIDYIAPEQAQDSRNADIRADIYSLGCTLYFMLTGDAPFPQGTVPQRLMQHQSAEPTDIRATRPDAPEELIAICRKMMAKAAADRYQSADEVSRALCEWLGEGEPKSGGSGAHPKMPPPSGPSLNEDLTLAPLDDEPAARGGSKQPAKPGDSKASGSGAGSTANKPDPSGAKKGPTSSIKNGEQVPTKPTSAIKSPAHQAPNLTKAGDPMDELLSGPALPSSEPPLQSTSLHMHTHPENPMVRSLLLVVGLGLGGAALVVGAILLIIWWSAGLF